MSDINGPRLSSRLTRLGQIGFVPGEGTTRLPYTPVSDEGRAYVQQCMEQAGLQTSVDAVGNLVGTLPGKGKTICIGSHIDTVPGGGIYDGTYGVLAGIECVQRLRELGYQNRHPIQVVAFTEEEGNVIGGTFGSKAFTGGEIDGAMRPNLALHGLTMEEVNACRRDLTQYQCYLELHIEQGGLLEAEGEQIGLAGGIVGIVRYRMTVSGCANHAGSTPMHLRDDALVSACRIITTLMDRARAASPDMVCTVGTLQVFPGAVNVIPGKVEFIVELRNPTMEPMDQVIASVLEEHVELTGEAYIRQEPTQCSPKLMELSERLCRGRGIRFRSMFSGAGHDLMNWGQTVPSMLLFIPSKDGISHSIREYSAPEDLDRGAQLLMEMVQALDQEEGDL